MDGLAGFVQWAFFSLVFEFVNNQIEGFQSGLLQRGTKWVSGMAFTLCTLWVFMQGFMIVTGRSRESMIGLVVGSLRVFLIVTAATAMSFAGTDLTKFLGDGLPAEVNKVVTGTDDDPAKSIDRNLKVMGLIFALIDRIDTGPSDPVNGQSQSRSITLMGIGIAGPSVIGGAMLLLYKIALVLFVGFGPLFILCLVFDQTKDLFKRWLLYGVGTMFSLAVLSFMVSVATKLVAITSAALLLQYQVASNMGIDGGGLNAAAMQQGGIGLLMSVLMVMAPPMAAMFFNGTLGQFAANSSFGSVGRNSSGQVSDFEQKTVPRVRQDNIETK
ncbi:type IV secretion system protein [Luteimonas deserti]|uniref:Type IV secretion system protein n=1 Tax=Luteimonas deserti TaxID=2752306 RepID=A0A7Z0TYJ4_9GAMM|nr:type IV secretion system protein [Luteimonas deserti]NYZ62422.1 type IV secretion system protein [Luteimonas deserti]